MVLQNKYKARASRRYKAAHNIDTHRPKSGRQESKSTPKTGGSEEEPSEGEREDDVLARESPSDPRDTVSTQFRVRRKTTNAWRYEEPESQEEEEEPEVDLSGLNARVAAMDVNEGTLASREESDAEDDGEGVFFEGAPQKKIQTLSTDEVDEMKKDIESADAARGTLMLTELRKRFTHESRAPANAAWRQTAKLPQGAVPVRQSIPARPQNTPQFDDIDDFLESIDSDAKHMAPPEALGTASTDIKTAGVPKNAASMQDFLDDLIG